MSRDLSADRADPRARSGARLRFENFELDVDAAELRRGGVAVRLQQQPCKVLALLASRSGELVTRDEIQRTVWGEDTYVNFDQGLNFCIKEIRAALGDQADTPSFVETLPRRGYRFLRPVEVESDPPYALEPEPPHVPDAALGGGPTPRSGWLWVLAAALAGLALGAIALRLVWGGGGSAAAPGRLMLAVLPFENLSSDPQWDYLSDGLTEEMIAQIGALQPDRLGVIARTSAMQYRSRDKDVEQIGAELGVDFIIEGSVRRGADRLRITVKLIQVSDQTQLWAQAYDREFGDLLAVQREVAEIVARSIRIELTPGAQAKLRRAGEIEPEAYELYLRARHAWNRRDPDGLRRAVGFFEQAIERAPDFALAHAGLADAWIMLGDRWVAPGEARQRARAAAERALELDMDLAEAQASMAMIQGSYEWNWEASLAGFERALSLSDGASIRLWYSYVLTALRRDAAALEQAEQALELDPLSLVVNTNLGSVLFRLGRFEEAAQRYRRTVEMDPGWGPGLRGVGRCQLAMGEREAGIRSLEQAAELARFPASALAHLAYGYASVGDMGGVRRVAERISAIEGYVSPYDRAVLLAALGERDLAFAALLEAVEQGHPMLRMLRADERLEALRDDPRFAKLAEAVRLGD